MRIIYLLPFFLFLFCVLPCIACVKRAKKINANTIHWGILGFCLGPIAFIIIAVIAAIQDDKFKKVYFGKEYKQCPFCSEKVASTAKKCKHCGEWFEDK